MSKIISFRLDDKNPREAQAIQIIEAWASRGYKLRYVLGEALLAYSEEQIRSNDISASLEKIITLLQQIPTQPDARTKSETQEGSLPECFLNGIVNASRPGLRLD